MIAAFPGVKFIHPASVRGDLLLHIGGEPVWLVKAPKHSLTDVVTVFRGVADDIELGDAGALGEHEVPEATRRRSMKRYKASGTERGYHVHSTVAAHLNDVRQSVHWPDLF